MPRPAALTTTVAVFAAALLAFGGAPVRVAGHGMLTIPPSRNFVAETEGKPYWDCSATDCSAVPRVEYCSHCLNRYNGFAPTADTIDASYCGVTQDGERGYTDVIAHDGSVIREPPVRATLTAGENLDVEFTITAHHKGHVEVGVCCLDPQKTSAADMVSCFKDNKATFVRDEYYNAPADGNYPKRGYIAPPSDNILGTSSASTGYSDMPFKMVYKLPEGQSGDRCLLQWMYYTGNSCEMPGYNDFAFPGDDWRQCGGVYSPCLSTCSFTGAPYGGERMVAGDRDDGEIGNVAPERFWNCADVAIRSSNGAAPATPDATPAAPDAEKPAPSPPPPAGSEDDTSLTCANGWTCLPAGDGRWECSEAPSASGDGEAEEAEDAPSPPPPASSEALVANWEQCGGINFCGGSDGPCRACADDWACKKEPGNDYYWQCVFPSYEFPVVEEEPDVADWGQCGGLTLCSEDAACRDCASPTWKCLKQPGNPWWHQCVPADYSFPVVRARAGRRRQASDQTAAAYRQLESFCSSISAGHRPDKTDKFANGKQLKRACQASKLDIYGTGTAVKVCTYKKKQCKALPKAGLLPSAP